MRQAVWFLVLMLWGTPVLAAQDCQSVATELKLPRKLKTRGKPRMAKWEDIDKTVNALADRLQGAACRFTFGQVFTSGREDILFPLTNSVVRIAPENALNGLTVVTREGNELGPYEGRVRYDRSGGLYAQRSYSLFHFQYRGPDSQMHAVGSRLLLDDFGVNWAELKDRAAIDTR
jgi:hypothetical protein